MISPITSVYTRSAQHLRATTTRLTGRVSLAYLSAVHAMSAAALWAGAVLLVAIPITEAAVGLDVITTVALIAPEWAAVIAIVMVGIYLYRRTRHRE
jgi:hypothetical protein